MWIKKRGLWRECCAMSWEIGEIQWQAQKAMDWQPLPESGKKQGKILPSSGFRESMALLALWFWTSSFQNWETISALRCHLVWCFVTAALRSRYTVVLTISLPCTDCTSHLHSFIHLLIKHSLSTNHVLDLILGVGDTVVTGHSSYPLEHRTGSRVDMDWPTDKSYSALVS